MSKGRGWHGQRSEHAEVGRLGGEAAQRRGSAHRLTNEERARGGRHSKGKRRTS